MNKNSTYGNEILFCEKQRFKQWWVWALLLTINGLFVFAIFKQVISGEEFGDNPMSNAGLLLTEGIILLLTILFLNLRLETQIRKDGIYIRFYPLHLSFRRFPWNKISKSFVRRYNAIGEYGGWGLRSGLFGKGKAINVSGNKGLQLEFSDNKRLLIGTNKPDELTETLISMGRLKS